APAAATLLDAAARVAERLPAGDPRDRAGAVAAALGEAGHRPVVAAAVAPCATADPPRADAARAVVLGLAVTARLATRLDVAVDRLPGFAATLAATAAHRPSPDTALRALGLVGTQTTAVAGTSASRAIDAGRARRAAADAVESASLAHHGFAGPARPLTGRRGLLSLLARRADPPLAGPALFDDAALDTLLGAVATQR
ncbi:MmgE/PrpD family protein, partial [Streptomyces sp. B6B3]|uniref:MmgE/PrpD family protein n=1 Tax=Streptomyces sp. B6B3 TaxID=3153570 RepID=UPI00325E2BA7